LVGVNGGDGPDAYPGRLTSMRIMLDNAGYGWIADTGLCQSTDDATAALVAVSRSSVRPPRRARGGLWLPHLFVRRNINMMSFIISPGLPARA
jgi:hypothetical protein